MLLKLIEIDILIERSPSLLYYLSLMENGFINADYSGSLFLCLLHLLLHLDQHLIVFLFEVQLIRASPTPADLNLLKFYFEFLVERSKEIHSDAL